MYLSNRDIQWAIRCGKLIIDPPPEHWGAGYDETSIDLHLDAVREAKIWNIPAFCKAKTGNPNSPPELVLGEFSYPEFSEAYLTRPPSEREAGGSRVFCRGDEQVVVLPGGFLLWQSKEVVGTPQKDPEYICFVNAKSTKARIGVIVHFTAPTIHAGWNGNITLEIANHGPFHLVLREGDVIAQLTVARISSAPDQDLRKAKSQTQGQKHVGGAQS